MRLFREGVRTDLRPAKFYGPAYASWDGSARKAAARVRVLLEEWFAAYPVERQAELRARFESEFDSAFFELTIHALLRALGCTVDVHPAGGNRRRPDFLASPLDGSSPFYVEAVSVADKSDEERQQDEWRARLNDDFNTLTYPDHWFLVGAMNGRPTGPLSRTRMRRFIDGLLVSLDPDKMSQALAQPEARQLIEGTFRDAGFTLNVAIFTRSAAYRGDTTSRPAVAYPIKMAWGDRSQSLYRAIDAKASRYGTLNRAFVLAVNAVSEWGVDSEDTKIALLGDAKRPDAAFVHAGKSINTRLSGVLVAYDLRPTNIPLAPIRLYEHSVATHPLSGPLLSLPTAMRAGESFDFHDGQGLGTIFDLPAAWAAQPGED